MVRDRESPTTRKQSSRAARVRSARKGDGETLEEGRELTSPALFYTLTVSEEALEAATESPVRPLSGSSWIEATRPL